MKEEQRDRITRWTEGARLLRVHVDSPVTDPWRWLDSPAASDSSIFAWEDARSGLRIAAVGELLTWEPEEEQRFEGAADVLGRWSSGLVEDDIPDGVPMVYAGFCFSAKTPDTHSAWAQWSRARMVVPRILAYQQGHRGGAIVAGVLEPGCDEGALRAKLEKIGRSALGDIRTDDEYSLLTKQSAVGEPGVAGREHWCSTVAAATAEIRSGALEKVVLARCASIESKVRPLVLLRSLSERNRRGYSFCVGNPRRGYFVGATPETLARVEQGGLTAHALAGTAPRGGTPQEDRIRGEELASSTKNRHEHGVTLAAIREALAPVCQSLHVDASPKLVCLAHVQHLETSIRGKLRADLGVLDVIGRLHPTPAVGGWPRADALQWIEDHEEMERGWYAAPIGWVGAGGDGVFAVAIRSVLLRDNHAYMYAGAGLVRDSEPEAEWVETALKLRTVSDALRYTGMQGGR